MIGRCTGLRARLVVTFALVAALTSIAVAGTSFVLVREAAIRRAMDTRIREVGLILEEAESTLQADDSPERVRAHLTAIPSLFTFGIAVDGWVPLGAETRDGHTLAIEDIPVGLRRAVERGEMAERRLDHDDGLALFVGRRISAEGPSIYFLFPLSGVVGDLALLRSVLIWTSTGMVVTSVAVGWSAANRLLRPLLRAHEAVQHLADGALETRVPVAGQDEFADLARTLNGMAAALERTVFELQEMETNHRRFVSDVSHELRTPVTALVAASGVLESNSGGLNPRGGRAAVLLVADVRRLADLIEDLMEISRVDDGTAPMVWVRLDVGALVEALLEERGWLSYVKVTIRDEIALTADPRRLRSIVANLVGNAMEHGSPPVYLSVARAEDSVRIEVADSGPGVAGEHVHRVFERFYKADPSRGKGTSGLGLAIARSNARLHGGELTLRSDGGGGATFCVSLPINPVETDPGAAQCDGAPPGAHMVADDQGA